MQQATSANERKNYASRNRILCIKYVFVSLFVCGMHWCIYLLNIVQWKWRYVLVLFSVFLSLSLNLSLSFFFCRFLVNSLCTWFRVDVVQCSVADLEFFTVIFSFCIAFGMFFRSHLNTAYAQHQFAFIQKFRHWLFRI